MDKQIEKLAKELDYCDNHKCMLSCAECRAKWLIENGYRKIDEGDVVLSRETWLEIQNYKYNLGFQTGTQIAHRKTIKEVFEKINERLCIFKLGNKSQEYEDGYTEAIDEVCGRLDELAKEMGVEL